MTTGPLSSPQLRELMEFLSIPSISADPDQRAALIAGARWIVELIRAAGGEADVADWRGSPIVDGWLPASSKAEQAPTVLCYGHFDVQPPGPRELWESDPFQPEIRDDRLYARGVADDKGQLWCLLRSAADLARDGVLPVNVRFCCDGEEEIGGVSVIEYLEATHESPDACLIFDTPMLDDGTPVFTIATRGTLSMHVEVRTGRRDLHSGVYGGAALNAVHVLVDALARVTPRAGRVPPSLLTDVLEPEPDELDSWSALPPGGDLLDEEGAAQADAQAGVEFYLRTWALPSLDVNGVEGGSPVQQKTIVPSAARANLTLRLARGQTAKRLAPIVEAELRRGLPASADLAFTVLAACDPGRLAADSTATRLALDAFARALGRRPLVLPSGGSLPIVPLLERLAIPAVITGFNTPSDNVHAPNERMRLSNLALALAAARETFLALAALPLHNPQPDSGVRPSD